MSFFRRIMTLAKEEGHRIVVLGEGTVLKSKEVVAVGALTAQDRHP